MTLPILDYQAFFVFMDISYGAFAPLRGFVHAFNLYVQMASISMFKISEATYLQKASCDHRDLPAWKVRPTHKPRLSKRLHD